MKKKQSSVVAGVGLTETFVLLIWEEVPESMKLCLIPCAELNGDDIQVFRTANGKLQNAVGLTEEQANAIDKLSNALCSKEEYIGESYRGTRWAMRFAKYIVEVGATIEGKHITSVYRTGYIM